LRVLLHLYRSLYQANFVKQTAHLSADILRLALRLCH
jgi:hypothetical protein